MYTWGYIVESCLAKLDMEQDEAIETRLFNKFPFYANEAMTQICSTCKPKMKYAEFKVISKDNFVNLLVNTFNIPKNYSLEFLDIDECHVEDLPIAPYNEREIYNFVKKENYKFVDTEIKMPKDFIAFGDEENLVNGQVMIDCDWKTLNGNSVIIYVQGNVKISYYGRWFFFTPNLKPEVKLDIPADIIDAIPSYIVSQCYKIDDESKANVYRNEFEVFLARMESNVGQSNKTFYCKGGW